MVKFGMTAGAGNVAIFNRIYSWRVRKVALAARRVQFALSGSERSRIMLGYSGKGMDGWRIGNDVAPVFSKFLSDVGRSFCMGGAVFGKVGRRCLLFRAL